MSHFKTLADGALEMVLFYVDGDSAHEICKAKVQAILKGQNE